MLNYILILIGKIVLALSKQLKLGSGSTWPGHVAMETNPKFIKEIIANNPQLRVVIVAGTNGKTTTSKILKQILSTSGLRVFQNEAGANLLNGIASTIISYSNIFGKINYDVAIFEVDERNVSLVLKEIKPYSIVLLNIFRDQLDRYGEVNQVVKDWESALLNTNEAILTTNGDDPELTYIAKKSNLQTDYFGLDDSLMKDGQVGHDVDFIYCPTCQTKLKYKKISFSHMGDFSCPKCKFTRELIIHVSKLYYPLFGVYNIYNTNAAAVTAFRSFDISQEIINEALKKFKPAFGRQEEINYKGKKIIMLLSKNPAGFNQSIEAINSLRKKGNILLLLNDRIPDGRDVSWIWDVDFEEIKDDAKIFISGDRSYDMGLRIRYSDINSNKNISPRFMVIENLSEAIDTAVSKTDKDEILFILPTYSGMLEAREILTGKKIL